MALHLQVVEPEEQLRTAFKVFDRNGNGKLNAMELKQTMTSFGEKMTKEEIDYMIRTADVTGDGQINYDGDTKLYATLFFITVEFRFL